MFNTVWHFLRLKHVKQRSITPRQMAARAIQYETSFSISSSHHWTRVWLDHFVQLLKYIYSTHSNSLTWKPTFSSVSPRASPGLTSFGRLLALSTHARHTPAPFKVKQMLFTLIDVMHGKPYRILTTSQGWYKDHQDRHVLDKSSFIFRLWDYKYCPPLVVAPVDWLVTCSYSKLLL